MAIKQFTAHLEGVYRMAFRRVQQLNFRQLDENGDSASNWKVHTYEAGTTNEIFTYSDSIGTQHENPITLSASGEANIYLDDGVVYRFIIKDTFGAIYDDQDNLTGDGGVTSGEGGYPPEGNIGNIQYKVGETTFGGDSNLNWDRVAQTLDLIGFLNVDGKINGGTLSGDNTGDQDLTGFVPYVGATASLDLGFNSLIVDNILSDTQFNVNIDNSQILSVDKNVVFTAPSISFSSDQVQTPLLNTVNSSTPMSLQVGSTEKVLFSNTLIDIKTDAEIQGELKLNSNITFLQASQAVISGASIAINTGAFRLVGDGISYDGSTLVAPEITASTKLWSDGDAEITGNLLATSGVFSGTAQVVKSASFADFARFGHINHNNGSSFGHMQNNLGRLLSSFPTGQAWQIRENNDANMQVEIEGGNITTTGTATTNGATNFGRLSSAPTPLSGGDSYYNTTNNIPYIWDGTDWLELTAGSSFGQLRTTRNAIAQTGITTVFTKVTQYTTNGIEEGSVSVDLPNDTMTLGDGIYEFYFGHDMTTTSSTVVMTFGVFDVTDTTFSNPYLEINRKIGTGSDVGAMGLSGLDTIVGTTEIALFVKADKNTDMTLTNATLKVIKIK